MSLDVEVEWPFTPESAGELGYWISLRAWQHPTDGACRRPAGLRLTANGLPVPLVVDTSVCLGGALKLGPFMSDQRLTVLLERDGRVHGEACFDGLMPGTAAIASLPPTGIVHGGDEITIVPPPELPSGAGMAKFYPLDGTWNSLGVTGQSARELDGVHVTVPTFNGPAALVIWGTGDADFPLPVCHGFYSCWAMSADTLGPFFVTEAP